MHPCSFLSMRSMHVYICPTLWDPMDCSLPGSPVLGILQARILEWVAIPSFSKSSWPRNWTCVSRVSWIAADSLLLNHQGSHWEVYHRKNIQFIYLFSWWWTLICFQFVVIMTKIAINICTQVFFCCCFILIFFIFILFFLILFLIFI